MVKCDVCFRGCELREGQTGFCGARICRGGEVIAANYGKITSLALDPIEKKPLNRFHPGSWILSVGSYGCNLRCPFCQNHEISWSAEAFSFAERAELVTPQELAEAAESSRSRGNIGVAFTYNEPLVGFEFVRDTARLVHERGMLNVLVSNGTASPRVLSEILPYIDAMNVDLKGFTDHYYTDVLGGNRAMTMNFIREAVKHCHVELTTLIVPGENDSPEEMEELASWIADLEDVYQEDREDLGSHDNSGHASSSASGSGRNIPLHISRFFPRFHMTDRQATDVALVYHLADVARKHLKYVYTGNC